MAASAPPLTTPLSLHLTTPLSLHQTLTSFLTVAIHTILYTRAIYPPATFVTTRAYNFPVHQSRHPAVCDWINASIASIALLLQKGAVKRVAVPIFDEDGAVMERFMFDVERFPVVEEKERWTEFEGENVGVRRQDVEEQLRGTVRRLDYACGKLKPLPEGCSFSVAVELRDEAEVPIGHPQPWIPSEPSLQMGEASSAGNDTVGRDLGGAKSTPVRLVEAGEFILETWIEEGKAKFEYDE